MGGLNRGRPLVEGLEAGPWSPRVPHEAREPFIQGRLLLSACLAYQLSFSWLYFLLYDFLVVLDDTIESVDPPQGDVLHQEGHFPDGSGK